MLLLEETKTMQATAASSGDRAGQLIGRSLVLNPHLCP